MHRSRACGGRSVISRQPAATALSAGPRLRRAEDRKRGCPTHAPGHWSLEATPAHPGGAGPCAHFADRELHHPPPAVQKARRDSGVCAREEMDPAHPASGKAPQKAQRPQSAMGGGGGAGSAECQARSSRRTPEPPHHGCPRRIWAPGSTATRTLDSSWGGCASLNPLPTLSQGPPRSECSLGWASPPRPRHRHLWLGSRQPTRPWHRAQMVHTGAARADRTVHARAGGLPACQGHNAGSPPSACP